MPDPGISNPGGGGQCIILLNFRENCMEIKKISQRRERAHPEFVFVDPPLLAAIACNSSIVFLFWGYEKYMCAFRVFKSQI